MKHDLSAIASEIQLECCGEQTLAQEFRDILKVLERHFGDDCQCDIPNRGLGPVNEVCDACGKKV